MPATVQSSPAPVLPETGFLRLADVLRIIPICKTAWFNGVRSGEFPKPVPLGKRARGYRVQDIRDLVDRLNSGEVAANDQ